MHVSIEESGVIERKLTISVAAEKIETEVTQRLKKRAKKARIPGFRPGKAPFGIIKQHYLPDVTNEVINDTIHSSYQDALTQEKVVVAGLLSIEHTPYEAGKELKYVATIELFPEIPMPTLAGKTITKPVVEIADEDVIDALKDLQKRRADFISDDGESAVDDRLTIDFEGRIDGELLGGGKTKNLSFILGSNEITADFDVALVGLKSGETKDINYTFHQSHDAPELAGKTVVYTATVKTVEKPQLPALDAAFAESMGIEEGGIEALKKSIRTLLQSELDRNIHAVLRGRVLDALYAVNDIAPPNMLVETEIDQLVQAVTEQRANRGLPAGKIDRDEYVDEAKKRVVIALVVDAVVEKFKIATDPEAVRTKMMEMSLYSEQSGEYAAWCRANIEKVKYVAAMELEDQVIACLLETATIEQQEMPFKTFMFTN